jgi:transposase-like protein
VGVSAKVFGVPKATLSNWVRDAAKGTLQGAGDKVVTPEQIQPYAVRATLACGTAQKRRIERRLRITGNRGRVTRFRVCLPVRHEAPEAERAAG